MPRTMLLRHKARENAVETRGLSRTMGVLPVLNCIDLEVCCGEVVALEGPNGAGKTTLLGCLAALLRPTAGQVLWFGRQAAQSPGDRALVGFLGHRTALYPHLTAYENLLFAAQMTSVDDPRGQVSRWLERTGLKGASGRLASELSRGMLQRLAIARALIHQPRIVLLDEPFAGLDSSGSDWLACLVCELRDRSCAVCIVSHLEQQAITLADRVLQLDGGRLVGAPPGARPGAVA